MLMRIRFSEGKMAPVPTIHKNRAGHTSATIGPAPRLGKDG